MSGGEIGSYRDADGARRTIVARQSAEGDWHVLDIDLESGLARVVEALAGDEDGRPQAEAIARDYLANVERLAAAAGREAGEAISVQGGRDAHSDRRPSTGARTQPARGVALPRQAR